MRQVQLSDERAARESGGGAANGLTGYQAITGATIELALTQAGGFALIAPGYVHKAKRVVRRGSSLSFKPLLTPTESGLAISGDF